MVSKQQIALILGLALAALSGYMAAFATYRYSLATPQTASIGRTVRLPVPRQALSRSVRVRACQEQSQATPSIGRREIMAAGTAGAALSLAQMRGAKADDENIFYGTAFPPGTYGGYDPDAKNKAVYTFAFPDGWKTDPPSKVEKGTKGIDGRVFNPSIPKKGQQAFVIVLSRAGEDNKSFALKDTEATFSGFVIADPDLQIALEAADEVKQSTRQVNGLTFYDYEIEGPGTNYLSSITVNNEGKLFALFVKAPANLMAKEKTNLQNIIKSFTLTGR
ncbi:hypothetical protein AAMO2058_001345300 [Amorphochlora amoebiformis]|uniref:PsbP C-terminal domain-containing protein n=1 Tax=Amorphochlora amoebiformis TaxID=1561963 RepID=A0A7S0CPI5_9EUKA|mmetsp:Transcript_1022/g.1430  ORF Transcript_1022/g.1430 Transcript_1022/m.1430 type:complete len:277 (+) Transcript_1022:47-877(+)